MANDVPAGGHHLPWCTWGNRPKNLCKVARRTRNIKHDKGGEREMPDTRTTAPRKEKHSNDNRTTPATRQAPTWAPFTFQGLSCELGHAAHGRFMKTRPALTHLDRLRSCRAHESPSGGSIVAQAKRDTVPRGVPARCRTGRLEEPWHAQPNTPHPRTTRIETNG